MIKSGDAEKAGEFSVALLDLRKSPEYLSAAPMEKYGMELDVLKNICRERHARRRVEQGHQGRALSLFGRVRNRPDAEAGRADV